LKLFPRTLLWRTFFLMAVLMLASVLAWFAIFSTYEREPRARQLAQTIVSVANLTRTAMITARIDARRQLLTELSDREGIHIYPAEDHDKIAPLPDLPFLQYVDALVKERLGPETRLTLEREGEQALFVSFRIEDDEYWVALPRERLDRHFPVQWLGWGAAALLMSLAGAWIIVSRVVRPLKILGRAAREIGRGGSPPPVEEQGADELRLLARAFNQMNTDLAQLDQDRALILAGVSHDLRTPLTRLRMGIEMSGADEFTREAMSADVEEMDKTIGQFLDFARADGGEAAVETDLAALLTEVVERAQRRGAPVHAEIAPLPAVTLRPQALRRAVTNLVENAQRYAGNELPIDLSLRQEARRIIIEVGDRGPGIPADQVDRVKRPFTRLDEARSNTGGAGLGLAIVDRIARHQGGRLDLLPRDGGGLLARITLPL
jgi:two-component system osmolarity sensor histidine kinase EnvZ